MSKRKVRRLGAVVYLIAHGFRVGDCGAEEAVPLQSPVQAGSVVVARRLSSYGSSVQ